MKEIRNSRWCDSVFLIGALIWILPTLCNAQVFCVRQGASGNGSDWNNAYPTLPAVLQRGATYYIAAGSYAAYDFNDAPSGNAYITIKKATESDHGPAAGWNSSFGTGQAVFESPLLFSSPNWIFDGQTRDESDWFSGASYGFKIAVNGQDSQIQIIHTDVDNVQIKYTFLESKTNALPDVTVARYAMNLNDPEAQFGYSRPNGRFTGMMVHRCLFLGGSVPIFVRAADGMVVEFCAMADNQSNPANHAEGISAYFGCNGFIVRYNKFRAIQGTAVLAFTGNNWDIYGNVIWNHAVGDGVVTGFGAGATANQNKFHHNTIVDRVGGFNSGVSYQPGSIGNEAFNNLWMNAGLLVIDGTHDFNAFWDSISRGETNAQLNVPTSVFVNYAGRDFRLALPTASGTTLPKTYQTDLLGKTRGADGSWDRGAFEFDESRSGPVISVSPSTLRFGSLPVNTTRDLTFTVQNSGIGTLAGIVKATPPFSIVSGGAYNLGANQSQTVMIRWSPIASGSNWQSFTFTGGGGAMCEATGISTP